jgi:hypothetical protein
VDLAALVDRAARMPEAGMAASDNGQPAVAVRRLRAGLRLIEGAAADGDRAMVDVRVRLPVSLAWAESERGRRRPSAAFWRGCREPCR